MLSEIRSAAGRLSRRVRRLANRSGRRHDVDPYRIPWPGVDQVSDAALRTAQAGQQRRGGAAIMLHGVMPRSGTVFVGELLRLHPALYAYPNNMWEIPFLSLAEDLRRLQVSFIQGYKHNEGRLSECDLLPVFGSAFLDHLHGYGVAKGQRLLLKEAGVVHLGAFPVVFPAENLLLLLRDGRDLVHSTMRTWPNTDFAETCRQWAASTRTVLDYYDRYRERTPPCWLVTYEDVQQNPGTFVRNACERFGLPVDDYPFDEISNVRLIGSSTVSETGQVDWSKHHAAPRQFRPVGHWESWSASRKRLFKRIAGDMLIRAGYSTDDRW